MPDTPAHSLNPMILMYLLMWLLDLVQNVLIDREGLSDLKHVYLVCFGIGGGTFLSGCFFLSMLLTTPCQPLLQIGIGRGWQGPISPASLVRTHHSLHSPFFLPDVVITAVPKHVLPSSLHGVIVGLDASACPHSNSGQVCVHISTRCA